jgi:hypothetical protein
MAGHFFRAEFEDNQSFVSFMVTFLTGTVGWEVAEDVADTGSDRDVVFSSPGEPEVPNGFKRYIRLRGNGSTLELKTYETFESTSINTGELSSTSGSIPNNYEWFVVADLERVVIRVAHYNDSSESLLYVGRINSYYRANEHNYPNFTKATGGWISNTGLMLDVGGAATGYNETLLADSTTLNAGHESDRDGSSTFAAVTLYNDDADSSKSELVGEYRGVYLISSIRAAMSTFVNIDGEIYVVLEAGGSFAAVGPIGTAVPDLTPGAIQ